MNQNKRHKKIDGIVIPFKNLSLQILPYLFILLALSLLLISRINNDITASIRLFILDTTAPIINVVSTPFIALSDTLTGFTNIRAIKAENLHLTEENKRLRQWYETALHLEAENKSLRNFLNLKNDPDLSYLTTRIIADSGGSFVKSILIPVGQNDGVKKGQAALSANGMIGRITEAGNNAARILLITDLNSRIPVLIQNTLHRAILTGDNTDFLKLERLPPDISIEVGSRIVTSGYGGLLPADLPIGTVVKSTPEGIFVKPHANLRQITHVQVVDTQLNPSLVSGKITEGSD